MRYIHSTTYVKLGDFYVAYATYDRNDNDVVDISCIGLCTNKSEAKPFIDTLVAQVVAKAIGGSIIEVRTFEDDVVVVDYKEEN